MIRRQKAGRLVGTGKSQGPLGRVIPEPPDSWQKQEFIEFQEVKIPVNQARESVYDYESRKNLKNKLILEKVLLGTNINST